MPGIVVLTAGGDYAARLLLGLGVRGVIPEATFVVPHLHFALPSRGTINVHPGLLPWIRGVHVVEHAVERRVPVGVTAHFVNAGIDTGNIIRRELIPVGRGDTLRSLRRKSSERCTELLIELAAGVMRGEHPDGLAQQTRFPYCKWLRDAQLRDIDAKVASGEAMELHASWSAYFGSDIIPLDRNDYPPIATAPLLETGG